MRKYIFFLGKNKREAPVENKPEPAAAPLTNGFEHQTEEPKPVPEKPVKLASPAKKESTAPPKEKKSHESGKEKSNKKKKNEIDLVQNLVNDGISVDFLIPVLNQAELTRNEIQFLIDFLLNKQQDTLVDHSEWSEGRGDVLIKMKKQLTEKEKALQEEQENGLGLQKKINDLRNDITAQRLQFNVTIKAQAEDINIKKNEIQNLASEIQYLKDKFGAEKQAMSVQYQQLQTKIIQEKKANNPELFQQLTETNAALSSELATKNVLITELKDQFQQHKFQINEEAMKQRAEYEHLIRIKDQEVHALRQRLQELTQREAEFGAINEENQRLRVDLLHKEDLDLKKKQFEIEQLKQQIDQMAKAAHHDDANKVEIRNLQNALDSSVKETNEYKKVIDDLNKQINDLQSSVNSYSAKNTEQLKQVSSFYIINVC